MTAYVDALKMLARRELSEQQIRQRLARRQYDADAIDEAVTRLKAERAIDDARTAAAIARTETGLKRRGQLRVRQALQKAGIDRQLTGKTIRETFDALDRDALIEGALMKRLRGRDTIEDEAEFARLYRYLAGQGFDADEVRKALDRHRRRR